MIFFLIFKLYRFFFKSQADVIIKLFILNYLFYFKSYNLIYYFIYIRSILLFSVHFHKKIVVLIFYFFLLQKYFFSTKNDV